MRVGVGDEVDGHVAFWVVGIAGVGGIVVAVLVKGTDFGLLQRH